MYIFFSWELVENNFVEKIITESQLKEKIEQSPFYILATEEDVKQYIPVNQRFVREVLDENKQKLQLIVAMLDELLNKNTPAEAAEKKE